MTYKKSVGSFRDGSKTGLRKSSSTQSAIDDSGNRSVESAANALSAQAGTRDAAQSNWKDPAPQDIWEALDRLALGIRNTRADINAFINAGLYVSEEDRKV